MPFPRRPPPPPPAMAAPRRLLAPLLLLLLLLGLVLAAPGPLGKAPDGKDAQDGLTRRLVRPRGARRGTSQRPGGWRRYRRPRPRLSHKGPMPF
ncbi:apelin [Serinus canaria]|uniref:apelin n=2 Tax=Carduelinae TaxID=37599 RepID=UPI0021CCE82B|nr:apelin [Serinus canaria]